MKQWNAQGVLTLSMLTLSLVAGAAHAQVAGSGTNEGSIETQVDDSNTNTTIEERRVEQNTISNSNNNVPLNLRNSRIESRPVEVTPGMSPTVVSPATPVVITAPARGSQIERSNGDPSLSVGAPSTGIGGANPGNANTGGVQVQSVNVQTTQDLDQKSRADVLRRERVRQELENETRLIEKVEEGRLDDERSRSNSIGGFNASAGAAATAKATSDGAVAVAQAQAASQAVTTVPVTAMGSGSSASAGASATAVSVGSNSNELSAEFRTESSSRFSINPFVGHRWNEDGYTQFKVQNLFVTGVNLSGQMNDFLALEGSFTYGRDNMKNRYGSLNGASYGGGAGYYGQAGYYNNAYSNGYASNGYASNGYNGGINGGYANNAYSSPFDYVRSRDSFDIAANAKLGLFTSKFRPYGLLGIGGSMQHYNIDNRYTTSQARVSGWDRNTSHVTGQFGGGVDVELASKFTVGARFDYQRIFGENKYVLMNQLYGDGLSRYTLTGSVQLLF